MKKILHWGVTLLASLLILVGIVFIVLPGPAIVVLGAGIWLFSRTHPGKIDPWVRQFMRINQRLARWVDGLFKGQGARR